MTDLCADSLIAEISRRSATLRRESSDEHKKQWSQYLTSSEVAAFMAGSLDLSGLGGHCRILDPGAGTGILGLSLAERVLRETSAAIELVPVEPEPNAFAQLQAVVQRARVQGGPRFVSTPLQRDALDLTNDTSAAFDLVIANPPYSKMSAADARAGGAPNSYARFMTVASRLLRPGGRMCFLVPRSFASGSYFKRFRVELFSQVVLERVHVFDSRKDVFRADGVLQETIIVVLRKKQCALELPPTTVAVSTSVGTADLCDARPMVLPYGEIVASSDADAVIRLPTTAEDQQVGRQVGRWTHRLKDFGFKVSTGPVVPFRARSLLFRAAGKQPRAPLLWLNHVRGDGSVRWPLGEDFHKEQYIDLDAANKLGVAQGNYVLVRRFSSKEERRRLTAACWISREHAPIRGFGIENHVNFIHRPGAAVSAVEARGIAAVLNSTVMDQYFRMVSGNTQVSATELGSLPMPPLVSIREIGLRVARAPARRDAIVGEFLAVC